jgi:hypothetical protein
MRGSTTIALLAGLFICVSAAATRAQMPATVSPPVTLSITLPDGSARTLTTHESGLATVTVNGRDYGFRPTMHDDAGMRMTVTIFDMGSQSDAVKEVGSVEVKGGGPATASKTTPAFKVQARKGVSNSTD